MIGGRVVVGFGVVVVVGGNSVVTERKCVTQFCSWEINAK